MGWFVLCAVFDVPVFLLLGWILFGDWDGFKEALWYHVKPDLFSLLDGTYFEDWWAELRFGTFALVCLGVLGAEFVWCVLGGPDALLGDVVESVKLLF